MAAVDKAVVIDVEADLMPHPNGRRWLRLVMTELEASSLLLSLQLGMGVDNGGS